MREKSSKKLVGKNKMNTVIDKNKAKKGKTPEKNLKNKLEASNSNSKKKIIFPKKNIKSNNSVELTRKIKGKDNKK